MFRVSNMEKAVVPTRMKFLDLMPLEEEKEEEKEEEAAERRRRRR